MKIVRFALTLLVSIGLLDDQARKSSQAFLPSSGNDLLCMDEILIRYSGILKSAYQTGLSEYIVRFRSRSQGYQEYYYKNGSSEK